MGVSVCLLTTDGTYLGFPGGGGGGARSGRSGVKLPMNRTYLGFPRGVGRGVAGSVRGSLARTDEPDILGVRGSLGSCQRSFCPSRSTGHTWPPAPPGTGHSFITMHRTYLDQPPHLMTMRQLAIVETYDANVHNDEPDMVRACTHDEPDILFTMYRTYLGRALTMYRTYHYR